MPGMMDFQMFGQSTAKEDGTREIRYADWMQMERNSGRVSTAHGTQLFQDDVHVQQMFRDNRLVVQLTADLSPVSMLSLRWHFSEKERFHEPVKVYGDAWERGYGDLEWRGVVPERMMPWVCALSNGSDQQPDTDARWTQCFGVMVQPAAFCMWQLDTDGISLWMDVRSGGEGVLLKGRTVTVCEIVFRCYQGMTAFEALKRFYDTLSPSRLRLEQPVYGSNNWYYAYGKSSDEDIRKDAELLADLTEGLENRPYMVIDDGWEKHMTDGPWSAGNERFPDMKALSGAIRDSHVLPGIWVRYLADGHEEWKVEKAARLQRDPHYLDPSHPLVLERIAEDTERLTMQWGYQLIKHDFSTCDLFGYWGFQRKGFLAGSDWHFFDRGRTSAEIVVRMYRTIYEHCPHGTILLGCNVIGHLAAGLVHMNRTGDDTSGVEWERTRKMGINTLAFRMLHHHTLYEADADCVGITGKIDWSMNRQWLQILSLSGTPLFVSCHPDQASGVVADDLRTAFIRASEQKDKLIPLDWMETTCPETWCVNGEKTGFRWFQETGMPMKM